MASRGLALLTRNIRGRASLSTRSGGDDQRKKSAALRAQVLRGTPKCSLETAIVSGERPPLLLDTNALVCLLETEGFSRPQASAITKALSATTSAAQRHALNNTVSKSSFADLRAELSILEKADFAVLKGDIAALEKRLDTQVAELYTSIERVENRIVKWVVAVAGAIGFGLVRVTGFGNGNSTQPPQPNPENYYASPTTGPPPPRL